jgi:hypothetical protein
MGTVLAGLALGLGVLGLSSAGAETVTVPPVVEVTTWRVSPPRTLESPRKRPLVKGHVVGMFINGSHCLGGPKPEYDHVKLVELPRTEDRSFKAAVITAYRRWPESSYTPARGPDYGKCLPNRDGTVFHRLRTKRPAADLRLFDGYFSPPRQVWPPVAGGPRTLR